MCLENEVTKHGKYVRLEDKVDPSSGFMKLSFFILLFNSILTTKFLWLSDLDMTFKIIVSIPIIL